MKFGQDYLGGVCYEKEILRTHNQGWVGGFFLRTFKRPDQKQADARSFIERMVKSGKFSEVVIHAAPFDHSHVYDFSKYLPQVKKDAAWADRVSRENPSCVVLFSPFCEHGHSAAQMIPVFNDLKALAPSCLMLNSVLNFGQVIEGVLTDVHLANGHKLMKPMGNYTVSFDGYEDMPSADVQAIIQFYSDARHIRAWNSRHNGKVKVNETTPEFDRTNWPSKEYLRGHNALMKSREGQKSWPKSMLYKNFAEDSKTDKKANKAMCILSVDAPFVKVYDENGTVIDRMKRVTPDFTGDPKGKRYYSSKYAFQLGNIAQANTGSRLIRIEGTPLTDADLRSGLFR